MCRTNQGLGGGCYVTLYQQSDDQMNTHGYGRWLMCLAKFEDLVCLFVDLSVSIAFVADTVHTARKEHNPQRVARQSRCRLRLASQPINTCT